MKKFIIEKFDRVIKNNLLVKCLNAYYNMYVRKNANNNAIMLTITATKARSNLFQLLKKVLKEQLPTRISSKDGTVILLPEEEYESLIETAELLSQKGLLESVKQAEKELEKGEVYSFDEVFKK